MFGFLIFIHEFGHFITARIFGVKVNEFALGMGPAIWKKQGKETLYALRLFPVGGYCAMEGEDEESDDPSAFINKPIWQRCIILAAGAFMNFVAGIIILVLLYMPVDAYITPVIAGFDDGFQYEGESMLMEGDEILKINGYNIFTYSDVSIFLAHDEGEPYDFEVLRDGRKVQLQDVPLTKEIFPTEVTDVNGNTTTEDQLRYGIAFTVKEAGIGDKLKLSALNAVDFVRLIKVSLFDLFSGKATVNDMSGPIGIASAINTTAQQSMTSMWNLVALIAINLAVMNLLPLPALDGGRIFFLLIELIRRKPIQPKYENIVHLVGLGLFLVLMLYVSFNDIMRIIKV